MNAAIAHGGDLDQARRLFPGAPEPWIDLSTGINPWPWPGPEGLPPLPISVWTRLPEPSLTAAALEAVAGHLGLNTTAPLVAAPGTQALIQRLAGLRRRARVVIAGPTYAEHARAWTTAGHAVRTLDPENWILAAPDADVAIIVNPNNPDGRTISPDALLELADHMAARGGWLVVDEAFADTTPTLSVAAWGGAPGLIITRSFGKFFGLAGARLGVMIGPPEVVAMMTAALGPWATPGPTLAIAALAHADRAWITATRARLAAAARRLDALIIANGHQIVGGTDLFRLMETPTGAPFARLARAGIWTRPFDYDPTWLRLGLPPDEAAWSRLAEALRDPQR